MRAKHYEPGSWKVGGHPKNNSGTDWREILATGEFGEMYMGEALKEDAERIVACVNGFEALEARLNGEFDNPALVKYGALSPIASEDLHRIISSVTAIMRAHSVR